jgi:hypothetical protein
MLYTLFGTLGFALAYEGTTLSPVIDNRFQFDEMCKEENIQDWSEYVCKTIRTNYQESNRVFEGSRMYTPAVNCLGMLDNDIHSSLHC